MSSGRVQTILTGLPIAFAAKRCRHGIVTVQAASESPANQVAAQHDLVLAAPQRLGQHRKDQRLPLVPGMNFENAVFFKSQRVDRFQREMHHGARGVSSLDLLLRRRERRLDARIVDQQGASVAIRNQLRCTILNVPLGYSRRLARTPCHLHQIGSAIRGDEAFREHHHPAGHGARRILQSEATKIAWYVLRRRVVNRDHLES